MAFPRVLTTALACVLFLAGLGFGSRVGAREWSQDLVRVATPSFITVGKRYAFTWAGGGPAQTYTIKAARNDGWVLVEVADENLNPVNAFPELPTRWLNAGAAISIQEMRPHP